MIQLMADDSQPAILKKLLLNGNLFAVILIIGNFAIFAGSLWVSNGYVSKPTFEAYTSGDAQRRDKTNDELVRIAVTLEGIKIKQEANAERDRRLLELERRMLEEERRK
jgi:hypothetical protein